MKKFIAMLAISTVALLTAAAGPVQANPDPTFAGTVSVIAGKGTGEAVYISRDRYVSASGGATSYTGPYRYVYPGGTSTSYWPDTDGWYLPAGKDFVTAYYTSYGWQASGRFTATGWHTISGTSLYGWIVNQ